MRPREFMALYLALACILFGLLMLTGCGTTTDRQTRTVTKRTLVTKPLVFHTPAGDIATDPLVIQEAIETDEVEQSKRVIDLPDAAPAIAAVAGATPWGGIIGGIVSAGVAAFAGKKALDFKRHRDELVDGIERAKDGLGDKWDTLTANLEAEQSRDTKAAVKARVG